MALAADPLRHPVSELPLVPFSAAPMEDCPLALVPEVPIPAPLLGVDELPVAAGFVVDEVPELGLVVGLVL